MVGPPRVRGARRGGRGAGWRHPPAAAGGLSGCGSWSPASRVPRPAGAPELALGERGFEIVLARRVAEGKAETQWFARHDSTPIIDLPAYWPDNYRRIVEKRIELIERRRDLALIERPECKRRWNTEPWDKQQERALRGWLLDLDRLEARALWFAPDANGEQQPTPRSVHSLADALRGDADFTAVAALWAADALGARDTDLAEIVGALVDAEHVSFLAAYRYQGKGFEKRADWERVWELQRAEDAVADRMGHDVTHPEVRRAVERELGTIPVPPKYGSGDFARTEYWRHRGKLDVSKERFVSYPAATRDGDAGGTCCSSIVESAPRHYDPPPTRPRISRPRPERGVWRVGRSLRFSPCCRRSSCTPARTSTTSPPRTSSRSARGTSAGTTGTRAACTAPGTCSAMSASSTPTRRCGRRCAKGSRPSRRWSTGARSAADRSGTCWCATCPSGHRAWISARCGNSPRPWPARSGPTSSTITPASTPSTCPPRSPTPGSNA
ncbi:MAG: DUF7008 domain-containing protein [Pseudonocardiaceae bacterium]